MSRRTVGTPEPSVSNHDMVVRVSLTRQSILAFKNRDWAGARRSKDEAMGRWVRAHGATSAFRLAQVLFEQVWERHDPAGRDDVSGLLQLTEKLSRAAAKRR